ncbi:hypothetical protein CSPAE12_02812, partial [Colletotrichum incanum]
FPLRAVPRFYLILIFSFTISSVTNAAESDTPKSSKASSTKRRLTDSLRILSVALRGSVIRCLRVSRSVKNVLAGVVLIIVIIIRSVNAELLRKQAELFRLTQAEIDTSLARLDRLRKEKQMIFKRGRKAAAKWPADSSVDPVVKAVHEVQASGRFSAINLSFLNSFNPSDPSWQSFSKLPVKGFMAKGSRTRDSPKGVTRSVRGS